MARENRFIMYTCEPCSEHNGAAWGYYEREDLRVLPSGMWVCDSCYDEEREDGTPMWSELPIPPEYVLARRLLALEAVVEALRPTLFETGTSADDARLLKALAALDKLKEG